MTGRRIYDDAACCRAGSRRRFIRRKHKARRRADGTRASILVAARPNARWSLDFVHDQLADGRRFRVLNIADDVTWECLAAIPDTSISGVRVARELTALITGRGRPEMIVSDHVLCREARGKFGQRNSERQLVLAAEGVLVAPSGFHC